MTKSISSRRVQQLAIVVVGALLIIVAFIRGKFLLGMGNGIIYALMTIGILWCFIRTFSQVEKPSIVRAVSVAIFSVLVGIAMAFPASINPNVQIEIDRKAIDRAARTELTRAFSTDPAFVGLSFSTVQLKVLNVTISGELPRHDDLEGLRDRIAIQCPALEHCVLHWSVTLRNTQQKLDGLDCDLFAADG